ncbi:hypothetical protein AS132_09840 [Photobacterium sanguinicancri]|nr:hypothetical protein AS132_09840 [Photobacterium sanguinicancri]
MCLRGLVGYSGKILSELLIPIIIITMNMIKKWNTLILDTKKPRLCWVFIKNKKLNFKFF